MEDGSAEPLSHGELRQIRALLRDMDRYQFAFSLVRRVGLAFAIMVGVLYGGRDLISRLWGVVIQ